METSFSQTFKVKENDTSLDFSIFAQGMRYRHFFHFVNHIKKVQSANKQNGYNSAPQTKFDKKKDILFSQTLKLKKY